MGIFETLFQRAEEERLSRPPDPLENVEVIRERFDKPVPVIFDYMIASIITLNCCSARGRGDGTRRGQVNHVACDRDLSLGRISRRRGQLLCGKKFREGLNATTQETISCPNCKELVEKHQLKPSIHPWKYESWY